MRISVVIPAYNEESRIGAMLDAYLPAFRERFGADFEFIVSVNGTTDRTADIVRARQAAYPQLRCIDDPRPIGKGGAIIAGGLQARGELVGFVDADGATPPSAFLDLVDHIGDAGLILASRRLPGAVLDPPHTLSRRIASWVFNALVRWFFSLKITDTQCGAKLMTAEAWHAVVPNIGLTRWAFDVDLIFKTRRAHYPIREIPTVWHDIGGSKLRLPLVSFQMFLAICRLRILYSPFSFIVRLYDRLLGRLPLRPQTG